MMETSVKIFLSFLMLLSAFRVQAVPAQQQVQPWLGVEVDTAVAGGVAVKCVIPGAPAERAGFATGDYITAIDKEAVKNRGELLLVLRNKGVGSKVTVRFRRKNKEQTKALKLEMLPDMLDLAKATLLNKSAPSFELTQVGTEKKTIRSSDLKGKAYILEFWATWCPACRAASPLINQWSKAHKDIPVIAVSDKDESVVSAFITRANIAPTYRQTIDKEQRLRGLYGMGSIPAFILVDQKGVVNDLTVGVGDYLETLLNKADALSKHKI